MNARVYRLDSSGPTNDAGQPVGGGSEIELYDGPIHRQHGDTRIGYSSYDVDEEADWTFWLPSRFLGRLPDIHPSDRVDFDDGVTGRIVNIEKLQAGYHVVQR